MKKLPIKNIRNFEWFLSTFKDTVYRVGGSLQPRLIQDYDYLIYSKQNAEKIKTYWKRTGLNIIDILPKNDNDEYFDKKCIIKFKIGNDLVDIIYVKDSDLYLSIKKYMDCYFPLSVQRVALCLKTHEFFGDPEKDPEVIYYKTFCSDTYIEKYKKYYPDSRFEMRDF